MAQQSINLGSQANDGTGDSIRDAFDKVNTNFTEVYTDLTLFNSVFSTGTQGLASAIATVYSVTATMANFSATQALFQSDLNDVANVLITKFDTITPLGGTGIGISNIDTTGPTAGFTVVNLGVTSLAGGGSISVSASTGSVTVSNLGVTSLSGSSYINVSGSTGSVTISNTGVTNLSGSTYIGVSASTGSVTLNNLGVQSLSGSDYINVSASTGSVTISNTGVKTLTAGTSTRVSSSTGTVTIWIEPPAVTLQTATDNNSTTTNEITIASANGHGGVGYAGLLTLTNTTGGSTNPNKFVRLNSTGDLQIVDSSYNNTLLSLTDTGALTLKDNLSIGNVLTLVVSTSAPATPVVGMFAVADRVNWDPAAKITGAAYPVFYNGSVWTALY